MDLAGDLRFALRSFRRTPVFTAVAVVSLALGIGANTAVFTLADQILLRLLPVKNPQELVQLRGQGSHHGSNRGGTRRTFRLLQLRDRNCCGLHHRQRNPASRAASESLPCVGPGVHWSPCGFRWPRAKVATSVTLARKLHDTTIGHSPGFASETRPHTRSPRCVI